jgi:hypothetical protein
MTDKTETRETSCFTYEVNMIVQILATNREEADDKLEREGGFVSKREVSFKDYVPLYNGSDSDKEKSSSKSENSKVSDSTPEKE